MKKSIVKATICAVIFCLMFCISACVSENFAAYTSEQEVNGIKIIETLSFNAKGDVIYQITDNIKLDFTGFEQEDIEQLKQTFASSITDVYATIEGVTCTDDLTNGIYTINAVIPCEENILDEISQAGVMEFTGDSKVLSLSVTGDSLEQSGYTKTE